jgi:hypothetical protein
LVRCTSASFVVLFPHLFAAGPVGGSRSGCRADVGMGLHATRDWLVRNGRIIAVVIVGLPAASLLRNGTSSLANQNRHRMRGTEHA